MSRLVGWGKPSEVAPLGIASRRAVLSGLFGLGVTQQPLYVSNQHTYLLRAAAEDLPSLANDDLVRSVDPMPVFTWLATGLLSVPGGLGIYACHALVAGLFYASLVGATEAFWNKNKRWSWPQEVCLWSVFALAHWQPLRGLGYWLFDGLAGQYLLRDFHQPAGFGIALLVAIWWAAKGRFYSSLLVAALAPTLHPTYALPGTFLAVVLCLDRGLRTQSLRAPVQGLALYAVAVAPIALRTLHSFGSVPAAVQAEAARILAQQRIPHHAHPSVWLPDGIQIAKLLLGLATAGWLIRAAPKELMTRVVAALTALVTISTVACWLFPSDRVGLFFPWRASVVLVPLCTVLVASALVTRASRKLEGNWGRLSTLWLVAVATAAVATNASSLVSPGTPRQLRGATASEELPPPLVAIVPPTLREDIRLSTGAPVYADWKSHPYRAEEVVEWARRIRRAQELYDHPSLANLEGLAAEGVTRLVVPNSWPLRVVASPTKEQSITWLSIDEAKHRLAEK